MRERLTELQLMEVIKYKDFIPQVTKRGPFGGPTEFETFSSIVNAANQWITNHSVEVMNVETIVLPNIFDEEEANTDRGVYWAVVTGGGGNWTFHQCLRVWYREPLST